MKFAFFGEAGSEKMFENDGHIHVYNPGPGAYNPMEYIFFINTIIQSV